MQFCLDTNTHATPGTAFLSIVPPSGDGIPIFRKLLYTTGTTPHTVTLLRCIGATTTNAPAESGQATIDLKSIDLTPGGGENLADDDYIAWIDKYGAIHFDKLLGAPSGNTVTLDGNLDEDVLYDAIVYGFYEVGRATHQQFTTPASETVDLSGMMAGYGSFAGGQYNRSGAGDPVLIHSNNLTAQGWLVLASGDYVSSDNQQTT